MASDGSSPSVDVSHERALARTFARALVTLLDLVIALYALGLLLALVAGGLDLGIVSLRNPAKPILVLTLLVPLRLAVAGAPRLAWERLIPWAGRREIVAAREHARVPAAAADAATALAVASLCSLAVAFVANILLVPSRARGFGLPFERAKLIEIFAAWDSGWYFDIARRGYYFSPDGQSSVPFFPLYPLLMRAVALPFGSTPEALWISGIVVSCAAFAASLAILHGLAERLTGSRETARRTVLYLAVFPFALFFTRVYAESVLLLTTVLAVRSAYEGRWVWAGTWGGLAALARPNGILVAVPLGLLALAGRPDARTLVHRIAALAPVPAALTSYCAYVYWLTGDPLAWLKAQQHWGYSIGHLPWQQLQRLIERLITYGPYDFFFASPFAPYRLLHGLTALLFLAMTPLVFARLGAPLGAYVLASLLVPLTGNALEGIGRYASVLFPVFIAAAMWRSPRLHEGILVVGALGLGLLSCLFVTLHPIY